MGYTTKVLDRYSQSYQQIAGAIAFALPAGWTKTWVLAELREDNGLIVGFYVMTNAEPIWLELPGPVYAAFRRLHHAALESNHEKQVWTNATMVLAKDGSFTVDYGYEPVPIEEEDERIDVWLTRYSPQT